MHRMVVVPCALLLLMFFPASPSPAQETVSNPNVVMDLKWENHRPAVRKDAEQGVRLCRRCRAGCPTDKWFKHSVETGDDLTSHLALARIYLDNPELDKNHSLAIYHLSVLANSEIRGGLFGMGYIYQQGLGVDADISVAKDYYRRAARLDHKVAQLRLAHMEFIDQPWKSLRKLLRARRQVRKLMRSTPNDSRLGLSDEHELEEFLEIWISIPH